MTPLLDRLNYGAPITPTPAEVSAAYTRVGALVPWLSLRLSRRLNIREAPPRVDGDDLDAPQGIIMASLIGLMVFVAFAKAVMS